MHEAEIDKMDSSIALYERCDSFFHVDLFLSSQINRSFEIK